MAVSLAGLLAAAGIILPAAAQLSGTVGPTTSSSAKASTKICNIMDYGGTASATTDNSDAISSAWTACKSGGQVYIPEGDYGLGTWLTLTGGTGVSINIEGTIYRTGTAGGNMIMIEHSSDIEVYSATAKGAIQGYGYEYHKTGSTSGPRILRFYDTTDFSVHDLALVDSPLFHLSLDTCENGELYNLIIHGGYQGGLDGIDVWSTNIWVHDVEVSNKDECVTVKSPSDHILVEQVHCNWSGGCAMGSLGAGTSVHDVEYRNIYTHNSNQMYMIKSNGGDGDVYNIAFNNFYGHSNAYTLDFDTAWSSMSAVDGDGITYSNISFSNWSGTAANGKTRGPIKVNCPSAVPCTDVSINDFTVGSDDGTTVLYGCQNAYGSGFCLNEGSSHTAYTTTQTATASAGAYTSMSNELSTGYDVSSSIPIPTMPASFFPGKAPISSIGLGASGSSASGSSGSSAAADAKATSSAKSTTAKSTAAAAAKSTTSKTTATAKSSTAKSTTTKAKAASTTKSSSSSKTTKAGAKAISVADVASSQVTTAPSSAAAETSAAAQSTSTRRQCRKRSQPLRMSE